MTDQQKQVLIQAAVASLQAGLIKDFATAKLLAEAVEALEKLG